MSDLSNGERVVYEAIKKAKNSGIWKKEIRSETGISDANLKKHLKVLETKKLIKPVSAIDVSLL